MYLQFSPAARLSNIYKRFIIALRNVRYIDDVDDVDEEVDKVDENGENNNEMTLTMVLTMTRTTTTLQSNPNGILPTAQSR